MSMKTCRQLIALLLTSYTTASASDSFVRSKFPEFETCSDLISVQKSHISPKTFEKTRGNSGHVDPLWRSRWTARDLASPTGTGVPCPAGAGQTQAHQQSDVNYFPNGVEPDFQPAFNQIEAMCPLSQAFIK